MKRLSLSLALLACGFAGQASALDLFGSMRAGTGYGYENYLTHSTPVLQTTAMHNYWLGGTQGGDCGCGAPAGDCGCGSDFPNCCGHSWLSGLHVPKLNLCIWRPFAHRGCCETDCCQAEAAPCGDCQPCRRRPLLSLIATLKANCPSFGCGCDACDTCGGEGMSMETEMIEMNMEETSPPPVPSPDADSAAWNLRSLDVLGLMR